MLEIIQSDTFHKWLDGLRSPRSRAKIQVRLDRLAMGNPGGAMPVGGGVFELQVDYGPGYLIYFKRVGSLFIVLLYANSGEAQAAHIKQAIRIAKSWN